MTVGRLCRRQMPSAEHLAATIRRSISVLGEARQTSGAVPDMIQVNIIQIEDAE